MIYRIVSSYQQIDIHLIQDEARKILSEASQKILHLSANFFIHIANFFRRLFGYEQYSLYSTNETQNRPIVNSIIPTHNPVSSTISPVTMHPSTAISLEEADVLTMAERKSLIESIAKEVQRKHLCEIFLITESNKEQLRSIMNKLYDINETSIQFGYVFNLIEGGKVQLQPISWENAQAYFKSSSHRLKDKITTKQFYRNWTNNYRLFNKFSTFSEKYIGSFKMIEAHTEAYHGTTTGNALKIREHGFVNDYETKYVLTHGLGVYAAFKEAKASEYANETIELPATEQQPTRSSVTFRGEVLQLRFKHAVQAADVSEEWTTFQNKLLQDIKDSIECKSPNITLKEKKEIKIQALGVLCRSLFQSTGCEVFIDGYPRSHSFLTNRGSLESDKDAGLYYYITNPDLVEVI